MSEPSGPTDSTTPRTPWAGAGMSERRERSADPIDENEGAAATSDGSPLIGASGANGEHA